MRNTYYILVFMLLSIAGNAQKLSYGLVFGGYLYGAANNNGSTIMLVENNFTPNLGCYLEYQLSKKWGVKTEIAFNKRKTIYAPVNYYQIKYPHQFSFFEVSPNLKLNFGSKYRNGGYMLLGPKISFMTKATSEGQDVSSNFESPNYGAQIGFGRRINKFIDIETKLDYEISPFFKLPNGNQSNFFGIYFLLNVDLERLIN